MSDSVTMPALGESVTEGTVTRWLKQVGDTVEVDEPLLEVSTDKVDTEIPSPVAGVVEQILVAEDETVDVGTPLAVIGAGQGGGAQPAQPEPTQAEQPEQPEPAQAKQPEPAAQEQEPQPEPAQAEPAAEQEQGASAEQGAPSSG